MQVKKNVIRAGFGAMALGASLLSLSVTAADNSSRSPASATYQQERAACENGQSNQARADCLREAGAASGEAQKGQLGNGNNRANYDQNAMARCTSLPMAEQEDCKRRLQEGASTGSVGGGGILREHRQVIGPGTNSGGGTPANGGMSSGTTGAGTK